jgi:hypothetical protein
MRRCTVYPRVPHPAIVLDAMSTTGAEWVHDLCEKLDETFWQ